MLKTKSMSKQSNWHHQQGGRAEGLGIANGKLQGETGQDKTENKNIEEKVAGQGGEAVITVTGKASQGMLLFWRAVSPLWAVGWLWGGVNKEHIPWDGTDIGEERVYWRWGW